MGSFPRYPAIIPQDAIDLTPVPPGFSNDFGNIVGNAGTDTDGFLAIIAEPVQYVLDHPSIMQGLDDSLQETAVAVADLNAPFHKDFADTLAEAILQGDPDFRQFEVHLTGNSPPQPGDGGPGGNLPVVHATGPVLACGAVQGFQSSAGQTFPEVANLQIRNGTTATITIKTLTWVQDEGGPFSVDVQCNGTLTPGQSCPLTLTLERAAPAGTTAQLQVLTDAADTPIVLCCTVGAATTGLTGGGVGSGGGPRILDCPECKLGG